MEEVRFKGGASTYCLSPHWRDSHLEVSQSGSAQETEAIPGILNISNIKINIKNCKLA